MGVVYLGIDPHEGLVAVKTTHPELARDDLIRRRFRLEVESARRVPPSCTARVIEDGTDQTPPYIITEYVEGRPLGRVVQSTGPLRPEQIGALATGVARALAAIHEAGLVHRDVKPSNVLLTPTGPKIIDFGIAQVIPASGGITQAGLLMGSPGWIPPERLRNGPASPASDVFGWGCLIAYAAAGANPFGAGDVDEVVRRTIEEPPCLDGLEPPLRAPVEAALAKDPAARPSAAELVAWLGEGTVPSVARAGRRRLKGPVMTAVGVLAMVIAFLATTGTERHAGASRPATATPVPGTDRPDRSTPPGPRRPGPGQPRPQPPNAPHDAGSVAQDAAPSLAQAPGPPGTSPSPAPRTSVTTTTTTPPGTPTPTSSPPSSSPTGGPSVGTGGQAGGGGQGGTGQTGAPITGG